MEKNKEIKKAMVLSSGGVDSTTIQTARSHMKAMSNSWRKQKEYRYRLMFRSEMAFFSHQQRVLHSQKDAV